MKKLTLEQLLTDFFKESDTVTVSAKELQDLLVNLNSKIVEQGNEIRALNKKIITLQLNKQMLNDKLDRLQIEQESNFKLDLKA